jgi:hypothetical protein
LIAHTVKRGEKVEILNAVDSFIKRHKYYLSQRKIYPDKTEFVRSEFLTAVVMTFYLLGYNAVRPVIILTTFQRNLLPPSSGLKSKPGKKHVASRGIFVACFLLGFAWLTISS